MFSLLLMSAYEYNTSNKDLLYERYLESISQKDKDALTLLYNATKSAVYGFVLSILKNPDDSEDVLQETYIKIFEAASTYQPSGKPMAWILTIAKNLAYMKLRQTKYNSDIDEMRDILPGEKGVEAHEDKIVLNAALKYLSDEERNILILHAVSGFKHREIAKFLQKPLSTVLSKYHRAIKKMKIMLAEEDLK